MLTSTFSPLFYVKCYIIPFAEALKPAIWCFKFCIAYVFGKLEYFFLQHGTWDGEFWLISLNHFQINLLISSLPALRALVSNSRKILSRYFKILTIWGFRTKNFSPKLRLPHPDLSLYLITSSFLLTLTLSSFGVLLFYLMHVGFTNECKSCEISNQTFIDTMFSFLKMKDELLMM